MFGLKGLKITMIQKFKNKLPILLLISLSFGCVKNNIDPVNNNIDNPVNNNIDNPVNNNIDNPVNNNIDNPVNNNIDPKESFACVKDDIVEKFPKIEIFTENSQDITSKENYVKGTAKILGRNEDENLTVNLKIRGRGNSTWTFPKKPYQIKFKDKEKVLGMPEDKKWILLANYTDKTMLRNELAFDISRLSNLAWTPESRFIELVINDEYQGIYQITQKVEESSNRVDIGDDGFLLEVDQLDRLDPDDIYFKTSNYLFNIKEPNLESKDDKYTFIKNYIQLTESVLLGDNFIDPVEGYTKYIDTASFIDWYLINEISKTNDANFYSSVYMNIVPEEQLKMGPVWDFDISFGNINYNDNESVEGFWIKQVVWISRLFEDPNFVADIKSRFNYFYDNRNTLYNQIKSNCSYLYNSQDENYSKWPTLGIQVWPNYKWFDTYDEEVNYLINWLDSRLEWLNIAINEL